jgi:hypothetical protein
VCECLHIDESQTRIARRTLGLHSPSSVRPSPLSIRTLTALTNVLKLRLSQVVRQSPRGTTVCTISLCVSLCPRSLSLSLSLSLFLALFLYLSSLSLSLSLFLSFSRARALSLSLSLSPLFSLIYSTRFRILALPLTPLLSAPRFLSFVFSPSLSLSNTNSTSYSPVVLARWSI